jgi:hypothetical protein
MYLHYSQFQSKIPVIHSVYVDGSATAQFVDNSSGTVDLSQIELTSATAAYTAGTLRLNITNGPDDISLSNTTNSVTTNKHEITFTSDSSGVKSFTKALLTASEQDATSGSTTTLIKIQENNATDILLDSDITAMTIDSVQLQPISQQSAKFDISLLRQNGQTTQTAACRTFLLHCRHGRKI